MAHKILPMTGPKGTKLTYITKEEEELLKERERSKGSITDKFYKGVPVLLDDGWGGSFLGEAPDPFAGPGTGGTGDWGGDPGSDAGGGDAAKDIDDKAEYMTEEECKRRGGRYDGMNLMSRTKKEQLTNIKILHQKLAPLLVKRRGQKH